MASPGPQIARGLASGLAMPARLAACGQAGGPGYKIGLLFDASVLDFNREKPASLGHALLAG